MAVSLVCFLTYQDLRKISLKASFLRVLAYGTPLRVYVSFVVRFSVITA